MPARRLCLLVALPLIAAAVRAATPSHIAIGKASVDVDPEVQSPTPEEAQLYAAFQTEAQAAFDRAKDAAAPLRRIRECEKYAEETTGAQQEEWKKNLVKARESRDPTYLAYLEAEQALDAALGRKLANMSRKERLDNPLMTSYVRVIPQILIRENTIPLYEETMEDYRKTYEKGRSAQPLGEGEFAGLRIGVDPTFDELSRHFAQLEKEQGLLPGLLHAVAWRESGGNPQQGAENADERGLFQIQDKDFQPKWNIPLLEPAASRWNDFQSLCKWIPFNTALAIHCLKRFVMQAEELGFRGDDRFQLAYRFYNESSGYILFSQARLRLYRQLFGVSSQELSETDINTLDRFIYFRQEEILQQYDWTVGEDGKRWCVVDLTEQSLKRRGSVGIPGLQMAAIGICTARGVVPTAELFHEYFPAQ
ncbi:MAG: hypothetical protein NTW86_27035 [Candidatus Sumerlaeota bacterium]|nr:hypothetical protein [Candidatus Sumerlaeota bacterium]